MEQCLLNNKVCPNLDKKCKVCKLDTCEEVLHMIETEEQANDRWKIKCIKEELEEQCKNCSFLQILDLNKQEVYCPYRIKERCMLK